MHPERLRAVYQEGIVLIRRTGRFFRRHTGYVAAGVSSLALACTPQVPTQKVIYQEVTATPTPVEQLVSAPPTSTPEPIEPTKTPEPTPARELPRILRETPVYGVYVGNLYAKIESGNVVGGILMSHLPNDSFLVAYTIKEPCPDGSRRAPTFIVPRAKIAGAGFSVDDMDTQMIPTIMSPEAIGGSLSAKELRVQGVVCSAVNGLSISTRLTNDTPSKDSLIKLYIALHGKYGTDLTREDALRHMEWPYRGPLPEIPAK